MSAPASAHACTSCPLGQAAQLVKLGVDMRSWDFVVALAGNPNTGKSTVFNHLTGLKQHTGNWPGKTVARAEGGLSYDSRRFKLIDLPGTYSLLSTSTDEEVARNFLLFGRPDVTVVVVDATRIERNLNLVFQILEITDRVVVCLNLVDEARHHGLVIDAERLADELGVPVVPTAARHGLGMNDLLRAISDVATGTRSTSPHRVKSGSAPLASALDLLVTKLEAAYPGLPNARWVALRLLEDDPRIVDAVRTGEIQDLVVHDGAAFARSPAEPGAASSAGREILADAASLHWKVGGNLHDVLTEALFEDAVRIVERVVSQRSAGRRRWDKTLDRVLTSRWTGFPIMLLILAGVFWLTIEGANAPSSVLDAFLIGRVHPWLKGVAAAASLPWWLSGFLIDGCYLATAWVVAVMLPPMAIFFPLFTLLEDFGYLPRVSYNLDRLFKAAGAHGKQALTMSMGFGCNAAGVIATRVIDSPRERLIAIITNNFALCNGRWPTQILIASLFIGTVAPPALAGLVSAAAVVGVALLGVFLTFVVSWALSRTALRGEASAFSLELPPYRPPRILRTLYTSMIDRTLLVLWRAVVFAMPAGAAIWLVGNVDVAGASVATHLIGWLDPFGLAIGLNGVILLAYIVAIPANEIVLPTILMLTVMTASMGGVGAGAGVMFESDTNIEIMRIFAGGGWTLLTAVSLMLFSLLHNPCSTTLWTIFKETRSRRIVLLSALIPLGLGISVCFLVARAWRIFGLPL